jgi:hypothetical protein
MSCTATSIKINPVNVLWKIEAQESWDFSGVTASGLGGQYVTMYLPDGTGYYAWFDENNLDTDPAPASLTEIEVNYAASALPSAIATAFQTAVNAVSGFTATVSGTKVTVIRDDVGEVTAATVGTASSVVLTTCRRGKNFDLGLLQGDIEPNFSPSNFIVQAHQYGLTPLASLSQGFEEISVETALLETSKSKLKELYKIYGGSVTPGGGTEIFGAGTAVLGKNILVDAARLVLKPVNSVNDTENFNIALCIPVPSSMVFSGENPQILNVTWQGFVDIDFNNKINAVSIGDIFQAGL